MKNKISILTSFLLIGMIGIAISGLTGFNPFAVTGTILGMASIAGPSLSNTLYSTPTTDVAAIAKWAGMYAKSMLNQVLNDLDIMKDCAVDRMVSRQGKLLPKFTAANGLRPLNTNVEENGRSERNFGGRKLFVYDAMKLFKIIPEELRESFLSDMLAPGAKDIPFAQWVWAREMEKLASELNDNIYLADYAGNAADWVAGDAYTYSASVPTYIKFGTDESIYKLLETTTAGQSPTTHPAKWDEVNSSAIATGFGTIIADEITATNLSPISAAAGSITDSNALDKIEALYKSMTPAHKNAGGQLYMSSDVFRKMLNHEKAEYPYQASKDSGDGERYIWGSGKKFKIVEASWMGSSQRLILTTKNNLVVGTNLSQTPGITKTVDILHGYKSVAKFLIGCEIGDLETLYVNDQA